MNVVFELFFWCHDWVSDFLVKQLFVIKTWLLLVAHLSLLGFLFPEWRSDFGSLALLVLVSLLFLSPLSRLLRMKLLLQLMGLRRELGILMGYLATVHGIGYLIDPDWFAFLVSPDVTIKYQFGLLAYFLTLPLLLTSNSWSNRVLGGKNWKRLHRLAYPLLVLALFHKFLRPGEMAITDMVIPIAVLVAYLGLKLMVAKNSLFLIQTYVTSIANRYREYRAKKAVSI